MKIAMLCVLGLMAVACRDGFFSDPRAVLTVDREYYQPVLGSRSAETGVSFVTAIAHLQNLSRDSIRFPRGGNCAPFNYQVLEERGESSAWGNFSSCIAIPVPDIVLGPFAERTDTLRIPTFPSAAGVTDKRAREGLFRLAYNGLASGQLVTLFSQAFEIGYSGN
jgi:hypothetical protein